MSSVGFRGVIGVFQYRDYARFTAGNSFSLIGLWMQRIGIGWLAWELTQSPTWLGIIAMAELFPVIFLGPIGGALADRFDKTRNMIIFQSIAMVASLALCIFTVVGLINIWILFAMTLIVGSASGLNQASRMALAPNLVPPTALTTAIAMNSMTFNTARFIGPAIAGVVIKLWGVEVAFGLNAFSYLTLIWALILIKLPPQTKEQKSRQRKSILSEIAEGVATVASNRGTITIMVIVLSSALFIRPVTQLLPGVSAELFSAGVDGFAALTASIGAGAIIGGYWMAQRGGSNNFSMALIGFLLAFCSCFAMVMMNNLFYALPFACSLGAGMVINGIGMQSTLQFSVPEHLRGRVLSLYGTTTVGGPAIGSLAMGMIAEKLGLQIPAASAAVFAMLIWLVVWPRRHDLTTALTSKSEAQN